MKGFVGVLLLVAVLYGCGSALGDDSGSGSGDDSVDRFTAEVMCERFVEDNLKSPSTAEFDSTGSGAGKHWTVTGTVDSENSFGAMMRNDYSCELTYEGNDRWRLDSLSGLTN
jgi:hypothetical protein